VSAWAGECAWEDKKRMALGTGGTRAQGHERWTSTENTTVFMQRLGTRERNGKRRTWGMEMGWREGDGGVWGATTNRTQFVKGRGAHGIGIGWVHQHGPWALGRGRRGHAQWTSSTALRTAMLWMQSKHCAPGMGHVGNVQ
jgi:hypothetical protein